MTRGIGVYDTVVHYFARDLIVRGFTLFDVSPATAYPVRKKKRGLPL